MTRHTRAGWESIALGAGIAIAAVLGPLVTGVIRFRTSANAENQFIGGEVVSLAVVAPVLVAAGVLWLRGSRSAPALAVGPALYAVYTYVTAVLGQEYGRYPGNVEKYFLLYAALVAGGAAVAAMAGAALVGMDLPPVPDGLRWFSAGMLLLIGAFFALAWLAQIRLVYAGEPPSEYEEGPALFWLIKLLDLGFLIPALVATGIGLLRRHPLATPAAYAMTTFVTCMALAIAGMAVAMEVKGDPASSPVMLAFVLPLAVVSAVVTAKLLGALAEARPRARRIGPKVDWRTHHAR
jgi:hypothetical protein